MHASPYVPCATIQQANSRLVLQTISSMLFVKQEKVNTNFFNIWMGM